MFCSSCLSNNTVDDANYCSLCGAKLEENIYAQIKTYFNKGYRYEVIVDLLRKFHGSDMHVRTLKRKLQEMGLKRRNNNVDIQIVRETIRREMEGAGELAGYRYVWHALRLRHGMHVPRRMVSAFMKEIDPVGVNERAKRKLRRRRYTSDGPNFCWHIDGEQCIQFILDFVNSLCVLG